MKKIILKFFISPYKFICRREDLEYINECTYINYELKDSRDNKLRINISFTLRLGYEHTVLDKISVILKRLCNNELLKYATIIVETIYVKFPTIINLIREDTALKLELECKSYNFKFRSIDLWLTVK